MRYRLIAVAALSILLALGLLIVPQAADAQTGATITVNTIADENNPTPNTTCSLREAITSANNNANYGGCVVVGSYGDDTITFGIFGEIFQGSSYPPIANNGTLTIAGPGAANLTLNGGFSYTVFNVSSGASLTVTRVQIRRGFDTVINNGTLNIASSVLTQTTGVVNAGTLDITATTFTDNNANANPGGGLNNGGTATVSGSAFLGNRASLGGAIYNSGSLTVSSTIFSGNSAGFYGGGILAIGGTTTVINSTIADNTADQDAGAIYVYNSGAPTVTLINSTVVNNTAGNTTRNGIVMDSGTLNLSNTIVAGSTTDCVRLGGTVNARNSLIESGLGCVNGVTTGSISGNPLLGAFTVNHYPLTASSPAVDTGDNALALDAGGSALTIDQIGGPRILNTTVDMGAVEFGNILNLVDVSLTPASATIAEGTSADFTVTRVTGDLSSPLVVNLGLSLGTNTLLTDFNIIDQANNPITTQVIIPAGSATATLTVTAVDDIFTEPGNSFTLSVASGAGYTPLTGSITAAIGIPANDFVVTTTADSGEGSLRQAMTNANDFPTDDTITFESSANGTISLNTAFPLPTIFNNGTLTINGNGVSNTIIDGNNTHRAFLVLSGAVVTISDLRVIRVQNNEEGGAIANAGTLTLNRTTLTGSAFGAGKGGVILNYSLSNLTVNGSTITGGQGFIGGGIHNAGTMAINGTLITGNAAGASGGGIYSSGPLTVTNSAIVNNTASNSLGGGIFIDGGSGFMINSAVINSTVSGNSAVSGGGIAIITGSVTRITNVTMAGNTATDGGGLYSFNSTVTINNSILAGNGASGDCARFGLSGQISASHSIIQQGIGCIDGTNTNNLAVDPLLGTFTGSYYPLSPIGSPALNTGSNALAVDAGGSALITDQIGGVRIRNGTVDRGAVEFGNTLDPVDVSLTPDNATIPEGSSANFTVTRITSDLSSPLVVNLGVVLGADTLIGDLSLFDQDNNPITTQVTIPAGSATATVTVVAVDDTFAEPINTFTLLVASGAANTTAVITIPANDLVVTTTADSGEGSLRQAITNANAFPSDDTITFESSANGTIPLASALPSISNNGTLTINGNGVSNTIIDGNDALRGFSVLSGATATISDLRVIRGRDNDEGGAIANSGTLTLNRTTLTGRVLGAGNGGVILNSAGATLTVNGGTITGGQGVNGGGIYNAGTAVVNGALITGNTVTANGGGIYSTGPLTVTNSAIIGNTASSGVGGGIFIGGGTNFIINSTASGNSASFGGAIAASGGGSTTRVTNMTFSDNTNGLYALNVAFTVNNSIFASTPCSGNSITGSFNVAAASSGCPATAYANLNLGTLANNGGPTQTIALLAGSPAIDTGSNALAVDANNNALTTDQRGTGYPRIVGVVDVGAYESPFLISTVTISAQTATANEGGTNGTFRIARGTDTAGALTVNFTKSGTATDGSDYTLGTSAIIADGTTFVDVTLTATDDAPAEADETVILTLANSTDYAIASAPNNTATVTIARNDFVVTNANASGEGSLQQAVDNANTIAGTDTIAFDTTFFSTPRTIDPGATLTLSQSVTINGPGAANVTISGGNARRVLTVDSGVTATINNVTIANGSFSGQGAGINNSGTAVINGVLITGNVALGRGGGIYSTGSLTVINSLILNNSSSFDLGGGIFIGGGTNFIINSTVSGNSASFGGAIAASGGGSTTRVTNVTFSGNTNGLYALNVAFTVNNSIFASTPCSGNSITGSFNVAAASSGCPATAYANLNLGTLANNGGSTHTIALLAGSPAIDTGSNALAVDANNNALTTDQRGTGYPRIVGVVDVGAYESPFLISTVTISAQTATANEGGTNGTFRIARGTDTAGALTVNFTKSGTATDGSDYTLGTSAIIPDGLTFVDVTLTATDDAPAEADETVILTLAGSTDYNVASAPNNTATVTIARNDFHVTNADASGEGSLRQAIDNANVIAGTDTITFDATFFSTPRTFTVTNLTGALPTLIESVTITGPGAGFATINGEFLLSARMLTINSGVTAGISGLTFASAVRGAIENNGSLAVSNSTFTSNTAAFGGAIRSSGSGTLTVTASTFTSNRATSTTAGQGGGAVFVSSTTSTITNSTFRSNTAAGGSGGGAVLVNGGALTVSNSTFSANTATSGGGISRSAGTGTVRNSILVSSTCAGTLTGTFNITTASSGCPDGDSFTVAQINLGALANNGGPTQTFALLTGSVAIDAGSNALAVDASNNALTTDQRGTGYPRIAGARVDVGAYESAPAPATVTIAAQTATAIEGGTNGTFRIARGTDTAGDLIINFTKSGTATDGSDYTLGTSATILNGNTFVDVTLTATDDAAAEADETVILTLASGTGYVVAAAPNDTATVTIARNDVVVTSTSDSGEGSLRQAVENALIFGGSPTVTFSGVAAPIVLSSPVTINGGVTIDGGSAITVDTANDSFRAFTVTGGTVLLRSFIINGGGIEASGGTLTIGNSPVIIIGNNTNVCGGGLLVNGGTVILQAGSQINSNTTTDNGGGICVTSGSLTVTGSGTQVNGNTATLDGGGIYVSGGTVIVESGASVSGNTATNGGGIHQAGGDVSVTDSFIQQNTGGAIAFASSGIRTVTNTCIVLNTDTAVSFTGGSGVIATNNWWGTAAGPFSGLDTPTPPNDDNTVGSYGDSVTPSTDASVFDYSSYQTVAPSGCYACSVPSAMGGIDRAGRICSIVP